MKIEEDDFKFVSLVYSELARQADSQGIGTLSPAERVVVHACWAKSEIDNGGFALLYCTHVDIDDVIAALSEIGLHDLAKAAIESKNVFPNGVPYKDSKDRENFVNKINDPAEGKDPWAENDRVVWSAESEFDSAVSKYIKGHISRYTAPANT